VESLGLLELVDKILLLKVRNEPMEVLMWLGTVVLGGVIGGLVAHKLKKITEKKS
jgi:hypothetical protein